MLLWSENGLQAQPTVKGQTMHTIEIDFDVFKELTTRRANEDVTYNDVLRELLHLGPARRETRPVDGTSEGQAWRVKGVLFPDGTAFRAKYKGETHTGQVEDGALKVNGRPYDSPSAAAVSITGAPVNGWTFWQAKLPGQADWRVIDGFRN